MMMAWIVDLEDNSRIENGCDYSLRMLLHVSINKLEILQYEYRICDSENVCINKNHMVKKQKEGRSRQILVMKRLLIYPKILLLLGLILNLTMKIFSLVL